MNERLERNLAALARRSPAAVHAIARAELPSAVRLFAAQDGHVSGEDSRDGAPRLLASAKDPAAEALAWAQGVDAKQAAVIAVRGAGLWHHVFTLADRMKRSGAIVLYEPDVSLLKFVLMHVDITPLLGAMAVSIVTDASDIGQIACSLEGTEGMVATGLMIVDHPPSRARLGLQRSTALEASATDCANAANTQHPAAMFAQGLTAAVQAVRTSVVTTLVQIETTIENLLGNLPLYIDGHGITDIAGTEKGKPAIIVSAGPSLRKNIDLLAQPGVRDRVVIIAVQTVLKQLLARGIKPHYVTALDYHPISTRFYEGLTAKDVQGITLVIDPKAHPAIARAFPGTVRVAASEILDKTLGAELARPMGEVAAGATVAHLAYYLAKHLGCKDVVLVGQDLGFTDNQYYSAGAAIHNVWSSELSDVHTLEGLEWQRIVRMRALLRRVPGALGGELYADEQMHTYRVQFEREFERDVRAGYRIIDATEGGSRKQHTVVMPLANALRELATSQPEPTRSAPASHVVQLSPRVTRTLARLDALALAADAITTTCEKANQTLTTLKSLYDDESQGLDPKQCDALIETAHTHARTSAGNAALWLVEHLNQTGQLRRFRADRELLLSEGMDAVSQQRKQVDRDMLNVQWLRDAGIRCSQLLRWARANVDAVASGKPPLDRTRGETQDDVATEVVDSQQPDANIKPLAPGVVGAIEAPTQPRVFGLVHAHPTRSGLGISRSWSLHKGESEINLFALTVQKLLACQGLDGVMIACDRQHADRVRDALRAAQIGWNSGDARVMIVEHEHEAALARHRSSVRAARCLQRHSWRGGAGQLCVYDEAMCAKVDSALLTQISKQIAGKAPTALLVVGDDWCALETQLCDAIVARHKANPSRHRMAFCQAPPGLAGLVIDCDLVHELAKGTSTAGSWWNTIGGLLGYHPMKPQMDAIAKDICVAIPATVRDTLMRCTGDDANFRCVLQHFLQPGDQSEAHACNQLSALQWCQHVATHALHHAHPLAPERIDIDASRLAQEQIPVLAEQIARLCEKYPATTLCLQLGACTGMGNWPALLDVARASGIWAVHVRVDHQALLIDSLAGDASMLEALLAARIDLLSVDLPGDGEQRWAATADREATWAAMQTLLDRVHARSCKGELPTRWLAAHMPKLTHTLADMELFYDRWMLACGTAVIDGCDQYALPRPAHVCARELWSRVRLGSIATEQNWQTDWDGTGLDKTGLVKTGLDRTGLDRNGLSQSAPRQSAPRQTMVFDGTQANVPAAQAQPFEGAI